MKKEESRALLFDKAHETIKAIDKAAIFQTKREYDPQCADLYFENNAKGRMYVCACYIWNDQPRCDVRIFAEV